MASFDSQMFTTIEPLQPVMWDALLDQRMIASYNQMFQSRNSYSSTDSSSSASPSSDGLSSPAPHQRTATVTAEKRGALPDKLERRREQNRQSQRAYRDRKEKHQHDLEGQINIWKRKHAELVKSYADQTEEVSQLKAQIEDLNAQVSLLQSGASDTWAQADQHDFDLDSFHDNKTAVWAQNSFGS